MGQEIKQQAIFKYLNIYPEISEKKSVIMNAEVTRYAIKDVENILQKKQVILVEKKILKNNHSNSKNFNPKFDFVEKTYKQRVIKRTVDLEIYFHITNEIGRAHV